MDNKMYLTDEYLQSNMVEQDYQQYLAVKYQHKMATTAFSKQMAEIVKKWAIENGAKYMAHWFFPLNNSVAQKFVTLDDNVSANKLIYSQTDASSFVSYGQVDTHKACGYLMWDISSRVFIQNLEFGKVLYLPSFFFDYKGNCLDYKIPLARACKAFDDSACRLLEKLGKKTAWVVSNVGLEQEFFMLDKSFVENKQDISLLGCQLTRDNLQIENNCYYSQPCMAVAKILGEVKEAMQKIGVRVSLFHSEVSPNQYEIVPDFDNCQISSQDNILLMETLKRVADKYGMVAIFNEKPFQNINGSGKHNNWSIMTSAGENLIDPSQNNPHIFLAFFTAILSAVNQNYKLLMSSVITVSNGYRLGGHEAPQGAFSAYIGNNLYDAIQRYIQTKEWKLAMPTKIKKYPIEITPDICNRNRTSTFAFTGTKFEFRAVGASQNSMLVNTFLLVSVAEQLSQIVDELNQGRDIDSILISKLKGCQNILYNGNCYKKSWKNLAKKRGIIDCKNNPLIYDEILSDDTLNMFAKHKVYSKIELKTLVYMLKRNFVEQTYNRAKVIKKIIEEQVLKENSDKILQNLSNDKNNKVKTKIERNIHLLEELINDLNVNKMDVSKCYCDILPIITKCQKLYSQYKNGI